MEKYNMKNSALVVIDLQNDITKNYREIIEKVNAATTVIGGFHLYEPTKKRYEMTVIWMHKAGTSLK